MPSNFELVLAGDFHVGNADISEHKIQRLKTKLKAKNNMFMSLGGDQLEAIDVSDKRFDLNTHGKGGMKSRIDIQRDAFIDYFMEVSDKILWILDGNHEKKWSNQFRPTNDIAEEFETIYANGPMVKALFPGFRLLDWHGYGFINSRAGDSAQRASNNRISLKRKLRDLPGADCEIVSSHHIHKIIIAPPNKSMEMISDKENSCLISHYTKPERIWIDAKKELYRIPEDDKWFVSSGSFLRNYVEDSASYAEWAGYRATELGVLIVEVRNDHIKNIREDHLE
jgi:hypothetical protein